MYNTHLLRATKLIINTMDYINVRPIAGE